MRPFASFDDLFPSDASENNCVIFPTPHSKEFTSKRILKFCLRLQNEFKNVWQHQQGQPKCRKFCTTSLYSKKEDSKRQQNVSKLFFVVYIVAYLRAFTVKPSLQRTPSGLRNSARYIKVSATYRFFLNWRIFVQKLTLGCYGISVIEPNCFGAEKFKHRKL